MVPIMGYLSIEIITNLCPCKYFSSGTLFNQIFYLNYVYIHGSISFTVVVFLYLFKEFFLLVMRDLLNPVYGMFRCYSESRMLWFSESVSWSFFRCFKNDHSIIFSKSLLILSCEAAYCVNYPYIMTTWVFS